MFFKNNNLKYLIDILNDNKIEYVFISSWDSIYRISEDEYIKIDFSFENENMYNNLMDEVMKKYNKDKKEDINIEILDSINIYIHKWNNGSFWITLIKRQ